VPRSPSNRNIPPLEPESLRRLALRYVERYATTEARLARYLERKVRERGWAGDAEPSIGPLVAQMAGLGYVNDRQFAEMRAAALVRRGYGRRRIDADLRFAGIGDDDLAAAAPSDDDEAREAALVFARRKRIGPFGKDALDPIARRRAFAAMVRAGHPLDIIKEILTVRE
jgi:regulatory protein